MDLVTNAEVLASWPKFAALDSTEQAALISAASQAIEDYCRRSFSSGVATETQNGTSRGRIWLKNRPVTSITSVTIAGRSIDNTNGDGWQFNGATGELVLGTGLANQRFAPWFPAGTNNVVIVYNWGYASVPTPVKRACLMTIRQLSEATKVAGVYTSERIGDYSYQLASDRQDSVPDAALRLLASYVQDDVV